jgi:hypothetical protein
MSLYDVEKISKKKERYENNVPNRLKVGPDRLTFYWRGINKNKKM